MKNEEKYGETYKTPYTHSLLGWIVLSVFVILINKEFGFAFLIGYLMHLVLDIIDTDEKQLFYPFKKKIRGFLPVFGYYEIVFSLVLVGVYFLF